MCHASLSHAEKSASQCETIAEKAFALNEVYPHDLNIQVQSSFCMNTDEIHREPPPGWLGGAEQKRPKKKR